jgi:NitT/TauT family transport system permease protein
VGYRLGQAGDLIQTDQVLASTLALIGLMVTIELGVLRPLETCLFRYAQ